MEWKDWEAAFSEPLTRYQMFTRAYASESPLQQLYIVDPAKPLTSGKSFVAGKEN